MPLHHERRGRERECQAQALGAEIPIALPPAGRAAMVTDEECVDYAREWVRLAGLTADEEIRGQLLAIPEPSTALVLVAGSMVLCGSRTWSRLSHWATSRA